MRHVPLGGASLATAQDRRFRGSAWWRMRDWNSRGVALHSPPELSSPSRSRSDRRLPRAGRPPGPNWPPSQARSWRDRTVAILRQPFGCYLLADVMAFPDHIEGTVEVAHSSAKVWAALTTAEGRVPGLVTRPRSVCARTHTFWSGIQSSRAARPPPG